MKKKLLALLCSVLLLLTACGGPSYRATDLTAKATTAAAPADADLSGPEAGAITAFSVELLRQTANEENALISPISVLTALSMTANGAAGNTLAQMEKMFGSSTAELNEYLHTYLSTLPDSETASCRPANSIWFRDDGQCLQVNEDFLNANAAYYGAGLFASPFDDAALQDINTWISDHTGGLIPQMLDSIPPDAMLYLINALVFDAKWDEAYSSHQITDGQFFPENGSPRQVRMMRSEESLWLEDTLATGFIKYYKDRTYAFAALLPNEGVSLDEYLSSLTGDNLRQTLVSAEGTAVHTAIPQFTCEYSTELSPVLKAMGMTDAFDSSLADLSAMGTSQAGNLYISRVLHKTYLALDDNGTQAAAATIVESPAESAPVEPEKAVCLDRPFVYLLIDCENRLPLFIGTIRDIGM